MLTFVNSDQPTPETSRKIFSLYELTKSLESVIGKAYQRPYWIRAEIAKLNFYPKSGHCYPDLVDKKDGATLAQIRGIIWSGPFMQVKQKFFEVTHEHLRDGMKVLLLASVHFHPTHGLTLQIADIDPSFTMGEMARERFESIARLKKEGLLNKNQSLPFPLLPQRVAIISIETSKGYQDFMQTITDNQQGYRLFTMLFPALLQGSGAIASIREQLERIKKVAHHFDLVVIIRGGGGDVGLSSFDNYTLASSVALFPLPVITGIGHATNETVVELVAHSNKITPTEVAYFLLQKFHDAAERVMEAEVQLFEQIAQVLYSENSLIDRLAERTSTRATEMISRQFNRLNINEITLVKELKSGLIKHRLMLENLTLKTGQTAKTELKSGLEKIIRQQSELTKSVPVFLKNNQRKTELLVEKLKLLDPKNILKRGFSITTVNGKSVKNATQLAEGVEIQTIFHKGKATSTIKKIED